MTDENTTKPDGWQEDRGPLWWREMYAGQQQYMGDYSHAAGSLGTAGHQHVAAWLGTCPTPDRLT
jgi:hypothetical protein